MGRLIKIPKIQLLLTLIFIFAVNFWQSPLSSRALIYLTAVGLTVLADVIFTFLTRKKFYVSDAALVTGSIIGLLISPAAPWYQVAVAASFAVGQKIFLRPLRRHIFNPGAFGLLAYGLIFGKTIAWWGPSLETTLSFIALLTPLLVSGWRMKKFPAIISYLVAYILWFVVQRGDLNVVSATILDPTLLFFAFVMLPEPMTSPVKFKNQILYGILVAVLVRTLTLPFFSQFNLPDSLIPALLIGTLVYPFVGVLRISTAPTTGTVFEWPTLLAMAVYWLIAFGLVQLFQFIKPVTPEEVEQTVDTQ